MSQLTNTLSSLLMSLPLIAVPCLAIFGLPSPDADPASEEEMGIELGVPSGLGKATAHPHEDHAHDSPFGSFQDAAATEEHVSANAAGNRAEIAPASGFQGAAANAAVGLDAEVASPHAHEEHDHAHEGHNHADEPSHGLETGENPFAEPAADQAVVETGAMVETSASDPGWDAALAQLRELGIQQFHLTNSDLPGRFFFCCSLRTSRNILQRFEAEAGTPAEAARDVLAQVESWQSTR